MGRLASKLYRDLARVWENIVQIEVEQKSFETNPQFIQIVPPGETVVVVSFQIKLFQSTGLLTICYPYVSLDPIMTRLSAQNWIDATKKKNLNADRELNLKNVGLVQANIAAELARSQLKIKDFLNLQIGDIVPVEKKIAEPVTIYVNKRRKFKARSGKKRAVQVIEPLDDVSQE